MTESPKPTPCATLYVHNIAHGRFVFVYGLKKKYEFKWNETHRKLIREYTSPSEFTAEEQDIRANTRSQHVVCTLMGSTNPVISATDSLTALIAAGRSIGSPARRAALVAIVERAQAAIAAIDAPPVDEETAAPPVVEVPEQAPPSALGPNGWKDAQTDVPLDVPPVPPIGEITMPVSKRGKHTQAELMQGEYAGVKTLAKNLGISLMRPQNGGAKSRGEVVDEIIAAEGSK